MTASKDDKQQVTTPAGYTQADTDLDSFPKWDFDKEPQLNGEIIKVKEDIEVEKAGVKRKTKMAVVKVDSDYYLLWMSANLEDFFKVLVPGMLVQVNYKGMVVLGNNNTMRDFDAFYK